MPVAERIVLVQKRLTDGARFIGEASEMSYDVDDARLDKDIRPQKVRRSRSI